MILIIKPVKLYFLSYHQVVNLSILSLAVVIKTEILNEFVCSEFSIIINHQQLLFTTCVVLGAVINYFLYDIWNSKPPLFRCDNDKPDTM